MSGVVSVRLTWQVQLPVIFTKKAYKLSCFHLSSYNENFCVSFHLQIFLVSSMSPDWKKNYDSLLKEDEETGEDNKKNYFYNSQPENFYILIHGQGETKI